MVQFYIDPKESKKNKDLNNIYKDGFFNLTQIWDNPVIISLPYFLQCSEDTFNNFTIDKLPISEF